jgi:hypothetical protein
MEDWINEVTSCNPYHLTVVVVGGLQRMAGNDGKMMMMHSLGSFFVLNFTRFLSFHV